MTVQDVCPPSVRERGRKISTNSKDPSCKNLYTSDYDKRVHSQTDSLLSFSSGFQNYRGLLNNCIVLLILSSFRLALDNLLKYGVLIDPVSGMVIFLGDPHRWPCAVLILVSNIFIQIMFFIEKLLATGRLPISVGSFIHVANLIMILIFPAAIVLTFQPPPWLSVIALMWYTILWLKYISYISVNKWLREGSMTNPPPEHPPDHDTADKMPNGNIHPSNLVKYPDNLTQSDLYYFLMAPTLCYELNFPRTKKIKVRFLLRRIAECLFLIGVILAIVQQWMIPAITNSFKPFKEMDYPRMVERIIKLAIPNHFMWLLFFYCFFHSFLNILAELLRFGDRTFYKDWWNSSTIQQFWKSWNIPVHRWAQRYWKNTNLNSLHVQIITSLAINAAGLFLKMLIMHCRHLYFPLRRRGYSQLTASLIVFLLSAFFHEFLVSIPLQMFRVWAFFGIVSQVPLALFTSMLPKDSAYGNLFVWLSLIMGQPIVLMMYGHDYYVLHAKSP